MKSVKLAAIILSAILVFACQKKEEVKKQSIPPTPAVLVSAESKNLSAFISTLGTTASFHSVQIVPQVSGQIVKINFKQGDNVKKGDIIAEIDTRPYRAEVLNAQGNLAKAKATLKIDQLEVERNRKLVKDNYVDKQTFDSYLAKVEIDKGAVESAQASLDLAKINLDWCYIKAPCDGKMGLYNINEGNVVSKGTSVISNIEFVDKLYVDFVIPSQKLYDVQQYMKKSKDGKMNINVAYIEDDYSNRKREAVVDIVLNKIRYSAGTAVLRGVLENKDHLFWPDQPVRVELNDGNAKPTVLVPDICVQMGPSQHYVYVATPYKNGVYILKQVNVKKGQLYGNMRAVEGIKAGDLVAMQVSQLRLQAGPFVYRATANGGIIGADGKVLTSPQAIGEFMANSGKIADELRADMMKKATQSKEKKSADKAPESTSK